VQCPECDAVVAPHRTICPECKAPIGRLEREGPPIQRSEAELKRNRRNVLILAALLLVVGSTTINPLSWFGFMDGDSGDRHRTPVTIEARQLFDAYRQDDREANRQYRNREMVVRGQFVRIVPDGNGAPDLRLATSDPQRPLGADLIQASHEQATRLRPGQQVTVSCRRMAGDRQERWLQNCSIQADTEEEAAPPAKS